MNYYDIWVDLAPGVNDLDFVDAVNEYLDFLKADGKLVGHRIRRRKLGFGPDVLGEFNITMKFEDLAQIDDAFFVAAKRSGEAERLHAAVWSKVSNFKSGLYRDFPDSVRES